MGSELHTELPEANVGILIATYGRPDELTETLRSLAVLDSPVEKIVVVDASPDPTRHEVEAAVLKASDFLPVEYLYSYIASSCVQRNIGATRLLDYGVDYIQVIDDDTRPSPDYVSRLLKLLNSFPNAVGASGVTVPFGKSTSLLDTFSIFIIISPL